MKRRPLEAVELERQGGTTVRAVVYSVDGHLIVHAAGFREPYLSQGAFLSGLREVWPWGRWRTLKGHKLTAVAVLPEEVS